MTNDTIPARAESSFSNSAQEEYRPEVLQRDQSMDASEASISSGQVRGRRLYSGDFSAPPEQLPSEMPPTAVTTPPSTDQAQQDEQVETLSPQHMGQEVSLEQVPEESQNNNDACFEEWPESNHDRTAAADKNSDDLEAGSYPTTTTASGLTETQYLEEMAPPLGKIPLEQDDTIIKEPCPGDPFAPRTGKCLIWRNVNMALAAKGKIPERKILDNVWGEVPKKEITAIMGPSGAGKTSLLNILAGRAASRGNLKIESDVRLDDSSVNPRSIKVRKLIAFVAQDESLQRTATPREAIAFSARLRLPRSTSDHAIEKLTKRMLTELGLDDCADTIIGSALVKGLSGGERKRTSIGVELVVKPSLVFLDEPTSGLDSFSAVQLCQVLKKVARAGASVLFTIHQPASEIFSSFDHLILLNKGRVMYDGPVASVPTFFAERGHPCPPHHNPADWIMNRAKAVPIDELDKAGFFPRDERKPENKLLTKSSSIVSRAPGGVLDEKGADMKKQVKLLLHRELNNLIRDKFAMAGRLGFSTLLSLLVGAIFKDVGMSSSVKIQNLQSHFGALVLACILGMVGCAQPALLAFPSERPVFVREYSTNHYSVLSYFLSRFIIEAVVTALQVFKICLITYYLIGFQLGFGIFFLTLYALAMSSTALAVCFGCAVEDPKLAQEMFPLLFIPQMLFSGFFIIPELIPVWIRWAQYTMALTFGTRIVMLKEFSDCGSPGAQTNCNLLVNSIEAEEDDVWIYWIVLAGLFVGFRVLALILLTKKATKFF